MLEIKLSNGNTTKLDCREENVLEYVNIQKEVCTKDSRFLIDPIEIISFTYIFK